MKKTHPFIRRSEYAKWCESLPENYPQLADFRRVVLRWVKGAENHWTTDDAHPGLGVCRMISQHTHVCTARALPTYAALAADADNTDTVWSRERIVGRLNAAIAFLCDTYDPNRPREGYWAKQPRPNSLRYETWIIGNMLDVVQIIPDALTAENQRRTREILVDVVEDERLSGRAESLQDYRHEGIIWTMNLFARGAIIYPDHPQAEEWLDLAKHGYASALSVPADQTDKTMIDGKELRDWVARRNGVFFSDFTLDHHSLGIHPGYMGAAAHRIVTLHDLLKRSGAALSPVWSNHFEDMMGVIKDLALWDGRVAYPNGKDWADYLYGVSDLRYLLAGLQMMCNDGEARLVEQGLFRQLEWLQLQRGQGDFGPSNAEYVFNVNDMKNIAFAYWVHQAHGFAKPVTKARFDRAHAKVRHSVEARFVCVREPKRFASWGWQGCGRNRVTGIILPGGHGFGDHLAQWDESLSPDYWTMSEQGRRRNLHFIPMQPRVETFRGGFAMSERVDIIAEKPRVKLDLYLSSQQLSSPYLYDPPPVSLVDQRVMVAIPDGRTVIFAASARAERQLSRLQTNDVNWRFERSVFSDMRRVIACKGGRKECLRISNVDTPWFNVDDILGVVPIGGPARISCRLTGKAANDFSTPPNGQTVSLSACSLPPQDYAPGQEIFTVCLAFVTDVDSTETRRLVKSCRVEEVGETIRVYRVRGQDDKQYVVAVNFSDTDASVLIPGRAPPRLLTPKAATLSKNTGKGVTLHLAPRPCALLVIPQEEH